MPGMLISIAMLATALMLSQPAPAAELQERPLGAEPYAGRLIDAHIHPRRQDRKKLEKHFADAREAGVTRVIVMRTPNDYRKTKRDQLLARAREFPNVTVLCSPSFGGLVFEGQIERARAEVARIGKDLAAGRCAGVGELGLRHYNKRWRRGGSQHEVTMALDHPLLHEVLALANRYAVPLVLHMEPVYIPRAINELPKIKRWYKAVCRKYPRARLIATHTGMMSPPDLEELLNACPNLFADFKVLHSRGSISGFMDLFGVNDLDFRFFEPWTALFEKYPDRFFFGSDWKEGRRRGNRRRSYRKHIALVRKMIGSLSPAVQEKIAYANAKRIFRLP